MSKSVKCIVNILVVEGITDYSIKYPNENLSESTGETNAFMELVPVSYNVNGDKNETNNVVYIDEVTDAFRSIADVVEVLNNNMTSLDMLSNDLHESNNVIIDSLANQQAASEEIAANAISSAELSECNLEDLGDVISELNEIADIIGSLSKMEGMSEAMNAESAESEEQAEGASDEADSGYMISPSGARVPIPVASNEPSGFVPPSPESLMGGAPGGFVPPSPESLMGGAPRGFVPPSPESLTEEDFEEPMEEEMPEEDFEEPMEEEMPEEDFEESMEEEMLEEDFEESMEEEMPEEDFEEPMEEEMPEEDFEDSMEEEMPEEEPSGFRPPSPESLAEEAR